MSVWSILRHNNVGERVGRRVAVLLIGCSAAAAATAHLPARPVLPGIDVWVASDFAPLAGRRIGLITNITGRSLDGRSTLDLLADSHGVQLAAIFALEHGLAAALEGTIEDGHHAASGLPVYSLYREPYRPTRQMLDGLDGLVFDVQDVGTRFYTYGTSMAYAMEEAARVGMPFVVLDRPDPIGGIAVSGPVADPSLKSFVSYASIPTRHGMTLGELARMYDEEHGLGAELTVIPAANWRRDQWFDATGLIWVNPSPNIRNLTQALLYPAVGPLETTNLSVGRGTDAPFEWLGAPWIRGRDLAASLNAAALPGVRFVARSLTPESGPYAGESCDGVNLLITDRDRFDAGRTSATLATALWQLHAADWEITSLPRQWGDPAIIAQLQAGWSADRIVASWQPGLDAFLLRRQRYLLYP